MGISKFPAVLIFAVVVVMMVTSRVAEAQTPSCLNSLTPCAAYLSGTGMPPASCCTPLKEAVTNQFPCPCNLYANPLVLQNLGINVTQATGLPARCNIATGSYSTVACGRQQSFPAAVLSPTAVAWKKQNKPTTTHVRDGSRNSLQRGHQFLPFPTAVAWKEALKDIVLFQCLCNLYGNITQATDLPSRCQIYLSCPSGSGVGRIAWAGLPSLLFFWASMMLY